MARPLRAPVPETLGSRVGAFERLRPPCIPPPPAPRRVEAPRMAGIRPPAVLASLALPAFAAAPPRALPYFAGVVLAPAGAESLRRFLLMASLRRSICPRSS
eukprot:CAMPEP_0118997792 /NCGR_PEP_ID=MMETSP1173-20130426/62416_1 /TAXON_ID=1034831 /ORGANISM="Rhizochromulina marina cf, Strain CCMP1243" /LENGTH=101 /DNA_ID=CAMNT_0006949255 /DNA_START=101 /DNA_END=406 /DNA_ORIENTATION=-